MKIQLFLASAAVCMISIAASADTWKCSLTNTAGISGIKNKAAAASWVPKEMTVVHESGKVLFSYFDETGEDASPKVTANGFEARDEIGLSAGQLSLLLKAKITFDSSTKTLKFRAPLKAAGYRNASIGGNYSCN